MWQCILKRRDILHLQLPFVARLLWLAQQPAAKGSVEVVLLTMSADKPASHATLVDHFVVLERRGCPYVESVFDSAAFGAAFAAGFLGAIVIDLSALLRKFLRSQRVETEELGVAAVGGSKFAYFRVRAFP